jgi:hypothetical protein
VPKAATQIGSNSPFAGTRHSSPGWPNRRTIHRISLCRFATPPAHGQRQGSHQVHTGCGQTSMSICAGLEDHPAHKSLPPPTQPLKPTCQLTPVTPRELFPTAPTRPAQWLPCPSPSADEVSRQLSQHTWLADWLLHHCRGTHRGAHAWRSPEKSAYSVLPTAG